MIPIEPTGTPPARIFEHIGTTPPCVPDSEKPDKLDNWLHQELVQQLAQRTRMLTEAKEALALEIRRREKVQASLMVAQGLESIAFLAGGLAHDLGNALAAMSMGYQLLEEQPNPVMAQKIAKNGRRAVEHGKELIANLMDFMRNRAAAPALVAPDVLLTEMDTMLGYAAGQHIACRLQAAPDVWPVWIAEHRLSSALLNLVVNARHAMPGGGEIAVSVSNVALGAARPASVGAGQFVRFCVADTGCGMTPDVLARATSPLFSTKAPGQGTGLGLYMVQRLAQEAAGYLHIDSQIGVGTQVSLYLPRSEDTPVATAQPDGDGAALALKAAVQEPLEETVQQTVQQPDPENALLERLMQRLRSPGLLAALLAWREARGGALLPVIDAVRCIAPEQVDSMFIAALEGTEAEPTFRFESIGSALLEKLGPGEQPNPAAVSEESLMGTLAGAYRRAARTGLPSYEYARYALGDGVPVRFERLILPASRDGRQVSHLLGIALFANLATPLNETPPS